MELKDLIVELSKINPMFPHASNLRTKVTSKKNTIKPQISKEIISLYLNYHTSLSNTLLNLSDAEKFVSFFEEYYCKIKESKYRIFSHQSDFLSSLLPEFFSILYSKIISQKFPNYFVDTQKDLIIDLSFLPYKSTPVSFKFKRVDVAILSHCDYNINGKSLLDFNIPLVAVEIKTNLDKNMISGVEYSVQRLKRTFPFCKYFLISEFADFAYNKQNYASSSIDEIFILRKQKRSDVRRLSNSIKGIDPDLLFNHMNEINDHLEKIEIAPSLLKERLRMGKLIKP